MTRPFFMSRRLLALGLAAALGLRADDGPHVFWHGEQATVLRYRGVQPLEAPLPASRRLELDGLPALVLSPAAPVPEPAEQPAPARIAAVSDIHGHLDSLVRLLQAQGVLGPDRAWAFGTGHLVVVGDSVDKGDQVTGLLWFLRSLDVQALAAGGRVHVLLGNHEVMELRGNARGLHRAYRGLDRTPRQLYGPDTDLGRWLRSRNVFLKLGDTLFVHGGPSPAMADQEQVLDRCNARIRQALDEPDKDPLLGKLGPIFYRGFLPLGASKFQDATPAEVEGLLKAFGAARAVVGHTVLARITAFHGGRVFGIDTGLEDGRPGELWLSLDGKRYRGLADGSRPPLP